MIKRLFVLALCLILGLVACSVAPPAGPRSPSSSATSASRAREGLRQNTGAGVTLASDHVYAPREAQAIAIPDFPGAHAIWGATGHDDRGHIWFGVSADAVEVPSAHLFEYVPETGDVYDRGDVVSALQRLGQDRPGESQMKIHTKIIHADDGYLYFASMDETGERTDGTQLPIWGSHIWRYRLDDHQWEHLQHVPEGMIAIAGMGRWIYLLGYFGHVLYQFDRDTHQFASVRVGSEGGHISRNFASDIYGKVYVPRVRRYSDASGDPDRVPPNVFNGLESTLVEFDTALNEVAEFPLPHYDPDLTAQSHGITGITYLADGSFTFTTHTGFLYQVFPHPEAPADVVPLGWFHPRGTAYCPSLFTMPGGRYLAGVSTIRSSRTHEWIIYDLNTRASTAVPLMLAPQIPSSDPRPRLLLYGSMTTDNQGAYYIAGRYRRRPDGLKVPVLWRVHD